MVAESGTAGPTRSGEGRNRTPGYVALAVVGPGGVATREVETGEGDRGVNMVRVSGCERRVLLRRDFADGGIVRRGGAEAGEGCDQGRCEVVDGGRKDGKEKARDMNVAWGELRSIRLEASRHVSLHPVDVESRAVRALSHPRDLVSRGAVSHPGSISSELLSMHIHALSTLAYRCRVCRFRSTSSPI